MKLRTISAFGMASSGAGAICAMLAGDFVLLAITSLFYVLNAWDLFSA